MSIIIAGTIDFPPEREQDILTPVAHLIEGARTEKGCRHYDWAHDPLKKGRILVFEEWDTEADLQAHFVGEWYLNMGVHFNELTMIGFDIKKYRFDIAEPVYDDAGKPRADFFTAK